MSENKKNCSKSHVSLYYIIGKYLAIIGINILEPATFLQQHLLNYFSYFI